MPTLLTERLRIIAAALVASAAAFLSSRSSIFMYFVWLVSWTGTAVLIVPRPYRPRFVAAMLAVMPAVWATLYVAAWLGR